MTLFGADPSVVGRTLVLDGEPRTVVGVMPPRFEWNIADLWLPAALRHSDDPQSARGFRAFQAHLRPGVTAEEAEAQLNVVAARRAAEHPDDYPPQSRFQVITVIDWVVREFRGVLYTLFGAVSLAGAPRSIERQRAHPMGLKPGEHVIGDSGVTPRRVRASLRPQCPAERKSPRSNILLFQ